MPLQHFHIQHKGFDSSKQTEIIADAYFEQRLLEGGVFHADMERVAAADFRIDRGEYSLPVFAQGSIPAGWITFGFLAPAREPMWINGRLVERTDFLLLAEESPIDARVFPGTTWNAVQVRRESLQLASLIVNRRELPLPSRGNASLKLAPHQAAKLRRLVEGAILQGRMVARGVMGDSEMPQRMLSELAIILAGALV